MGKTIEEVFVKDCSIVGGIRMVIQNPQRPVQKLQEPKRHFPGKSITWLSCPRELTQQIAVLPSSVTQKGCQKIVRTRRGDTPTPTPSPNCPCQRLLLASLSLLFSLGFSLGISPIFEEYRKVILENYPCLGFYCKSVIWNF